MSAFKPDVERVRAEVAALIAEFHLPGAGLGIVQGDDVTLAEGFGWADISAKRPYTPDVRHRIGSVTKTVIGLCAMALVDEGRLALEAGVPELLPDIQFKGNHQPLTVWHLLTHTGGIGEAPSPADLAKPFEKLFYESDPGLPLAALYDDGVTIEPVPGTKWSYANHGFALLAEIVSRIESAPIAGVAERRVFGPLAMTSSDMVDQPHRDLSRGYTQAETPEAWALLRMLGIQLESEKAVDGHNMPGKYTRVWGNGGAGAVQSTLADMAKYASALLGASRGIVRPKTFAAMTADQWRPDRRLPGWGLSFSVRDSERERHFGHGGAVFGGWNSYLAVFPELDAALIFHVNVMSDNFDVSMVPRIVRAFHGREDPPLGEIPIDPDVLASAAGVYECTEPGPLTNFRPTYQCGRVQLSVEDGGALMMYSRRGLWKDGARLRPVDPAQPDFFAIDTSGKTRQYMALLLDHKRRVTGLRFQQIVDMVRNEEREPWR